MSTLLAIQVLDLKRSLPMGDRQLHILNGLSFKVARREWIALTGPSGSGKSTLLGLLAGIDTSSSGKIVLHGIDITHMNERPLAKIRNRQIGIVFQSFHLIPTLSAQENVEVPLYISPQSRKAKQLAREMLELVGLCERLDHRPHQLSGGEQQRVAIARALVTRPSILLADEPTGNLDSASSQSVLDLFAKLRRELEVTMIMATHDPLVAQRTDRELHLIDGRFVPPARKRMDGPPVGIVRS